MKFKDLPAYLFIVLMMPFVSCQSETKKPEKAMEATRLVVSHFMDYQPMYADNVGITIDALRKEIMDAHDQGIDAFQVNVYRPDREGTPEVTALLYQAASECDFPFYIFLSTDHWNHNPRWTFEAILEYMQLYADHPNQLKINGRPLFCSWVGQHKGVDFWQTTKERLQDEYGIDILYVPFHGYDRGTTVEAIEGYLDEWEGVIDGYWAWGASNPPFPTDSKLYVPAFNATPHPTDPSGKDSTAFSSSNPDYFINNNANIPDDCEKLAAALKRRNIPYMTPVVPSFWASCWNPCKYTEYHAGFGMESQWMSIINNQDARWVNLVTWNDMGEDTHWSPAPDPNSSPNRPSEGHIWSHAGYAELNKYYIEWWKSDRKPVIENDKIFYFHRNQFADAVPLKESCPDEWKCNLNKPDKIYVTTMLVSPARLTIRSGTEITRYNAPAGVTHWDSPLGPGEQRFILERDGEEILNAVSGMTVDDPPEYKSWSFFSGFAER